MKSFLRYLIVAFGLCLLPAAANATCGTGTGTCFVVAAGGAWVSGTFSSTSGGVSCACTPAAGDALILDSAAGNLTSVAGNPSLASLDASGTGGSGSPYTHTFTHTSGQTITISGNLFTLVSGMTYTLGSTILSALAFTSTSGTTIITTAGKNIGNVTFNGVGGTFQFADAFSSPAGTMTLTNGTLDDATNNVNVTLVAFSSSNSNTRVLQMGTGTWKITGSNTVWDFTTTTGLTCTCGSSTLWLANTSLAQALLKGGGVATFGTLNVGPNSLGGEYAIQGANTFAALTATAPAYINFPAATTTTITAQFTLNGSSGNYIFLACGQLAICTIHASASGSTLSWAALYGMTFNTNAVSATNSFDLGNNVMDGGSITAPTGGGGNGGHIIGG